MIPFITYDEAGNSKSDVSYSYPDALRDGVVREAFFFALTRFRSGAGRWLVVVRMASEGYDCPDIRVVLRATNVTGEGAFRQIVARALRVVPGLSHQDAQVFLPADPRLLALARGLVHPLGRSLRTDDGQGIEGQGEAAFDRAWEGEAEARDEGGGVFVPLTSRAFGQRMVTSGAVVPASALERAGHECGSFGLFGFAGLCAGGGDCTDGVRGSGTGGNWVGSFSPGSFSPGSTWSGACLA